MKFSSGLFTATALCGILGGALSAFAQDDGFIETVVVTAQKREQNVQDVPISMVVLGQKQLESYNVADFKTLSTSVPGLFVQHAPGNDGMFLRGFGTAPNVPAADQEVTTYIDGIYGGRARQFMSPFFDVERIEILRGPQGALLGKNTAAGAISIVTANPKDEFEGSVSVSYNFDRKGVDAYGYVTGPITDDLSARLALKFTKMAGYINNIAINKTVPAPDNKQGRLGLKFTPSEGITVLTKFEYVSFYTTGNASINYRPLNTPVAQGLQSTNATKNAPSPFGVPEYDKQNGYNFSNNADFDLGSGYTLTSVTGFSAFKAESNANLGNDNPTRYYTQFGEYFSQGSQEIRLTSPADQTVDFIVGAYIDYHTYRSRQNLRYNVLAPVSTGSQTLTFSQKLFSYSFFANATWNITDELRLMGSTRYTLVSKRGHSISNITSGTGFLNAGPFNVADLIREGTFEP